MSIHLQSFLCTHQAATVHVLPAPGLNPRFDMKVTPTAQQHDKGQWVVTLAVVAELKTEADELLLSAACTFRGVFLIKDVSPEMEAFSANRALPARLYAHARCAIDALTRDCGYGAVVLPPARLELPDAQAASALHAQPGAVQPELADSGSKALTNSLEEEAAR